MSLKEKSIKSQQAGFDQIQNSQQQLEMKRHSMYLPQIESIKTTTSQ